MLSSFEKPYFNDPYIKNIVLFLFLNFIDRVYIQKSTLIIKAELRVLVYKVNTSV